MWSDVFIEFIRTNIDEKYSKPVIKELGMLADSKVGIDRVIESLQWNMWPNMERKPMENIKAQMLQRFEQEISKEEDGKPKYFYL